MDAHVVCFIDNLLAHYINLYRDPIMSCEASCLVLSYVLANTPMESNGQGWGAWSSLVEMC